MANEIDFIGKCLFIKDNERKILVVGDIHIGYGGIKDSASFISVCSLFNRIIEDLERVFRILGKVNKIIFLGDLKHSFSRSIEEERYGFVNLFDYLEKKTEEIIIIKGNHDNFIKNITKSRNILIEDFYELNNYLFLHGDRNFEGIWKSKAKYFIMGHLHPAISLREGVKTERYKCFLEGKYRKKKFIILPSFIEMGEGVDILEGRSNLAWEVDLSKFKIRIINENGEVLDFGKVKNINRSLLFV